MHNVLLIMLYGSLRHFIVLAVTQCIFLYYNMLLSNAQISLKMPLLACFLMVVCLYLKDGISNMPLSVLAMRMIVSYRACQSCHH